MHVESELHFLSGDTENTHTAANLAHSRGLTTVFTAPDASEKTKHTNTRAVLFPSLWGLRAQAIPTTQIVKQTVLSGCGDQQKWPHFAKKCPHLAS